MTLRWGILGLGSIVERGMAPALGRAADTVLAAVCSRSMEKARAVAAKYNVAKAYDCYEDMLRDPELDVVYIATPNSLHAAQTILAAEAGKHVLCEKPMKQALPQLLLVLAAVGVAGSAGAQAGSKAPA